VYRVSPISFYLQSFDFGVSVYSVACSN
jgi:hypothetical protein